MDLLADALYDFYRNGATSPFLVENRFTEPDQFPLNVFFRGEDDLSDLDDYALSLCKGDTLDVGAGVGTLSKILQSKGVTVTALEKSEPLCSLMKELGVKNVVNADFLKYKTESKYDTIFFLMNGIGLARTLNGLEQLFLKVKHMLKPGGQALFDSSDIEYFYTGETPKPEDHYYGELDYRYSYKGEVSEWSTWLYVDFWTAAEIAGRLNLVIDHLYDDGSDQYLARLTLNN